MKKIAVAACVLLGLASTAQAAGNPAAGKDKSSLCAACHGADGNSPVPNFPKLAGQSQEYIVKQLTEFKAGVRNDPTMSPMAAPLSETDVNDLAAYFSSQPRAAGVSASAELAARGQKLYMGGDSSKGLSACAACHGPQGAGNGPARFPALASQHATYTATTLQKFKSGERANGPMMRDIAARMSDADMQAVSEYMAGVH